MAPTSQLRVSIGNRPIPAQLSDSSYLRVENLNPGDRVRIEYPLQRRESAEVLCGREYRAVWLGDTVVGISPQGQEYPLYERSHFERGAAPTVPDRPYLDQTGGPVHW